MKYITPTTTSWRKYDESRKFLARGSSTNSKIPSESLRNLAPCMVAEAKGCRFRDLDGNEFIDFRNALGPVTLGYCYEPVNRAIVEQLRKGIVFSYPCPLEFEVAKQLTEIIPSAERARFLKTGGEAMAAAIKLARAFTGRDEVVRCGYNGWLQTIPDPGVPQAVADLFHPVPYGDTNAVKQVLHDRKGKIACMTLACNAYDKLTPEDTFPREVRALTKEADVLLIQDEIVTGFRLAVGGAQEYYGFTPDLAVFSKGMANGMPLAAYVGRADVMSGLESGATISSTFGGEALSLAAARACIGIYRTEDVIGHLWRMGERFMAGFNRAAELCRLPIRASGLAPCSAVVYVGSDGDKAADTIDVFYREIFRRGVMARPLFYINYSHKPSDIAESLERIEDAMRAVAGS